MCVNEMKNQQTPLETKAGWKSLLDNKESEDILAVTFDQIAKTKFLTKQEKQQLKRRKQERTIPIRQESVKRYPVQVPEKSAQQTYSGRFQEQMSESKRKRKQNMLGTDLHRKKLNAENVENAESKHQNEKDLLLEDVVRIIEDSDRTLDPDSRFLQGTTAADFVRKLDTTDKAEFLVNSRTQMETNMKVLSEETGLQECVRQFLELDLSADLRTDKALAKDADRLEKIKGKTMAMIRLVDRHPEIEENMAPREREEFEGKLDRAYAIVEYYQMRKDIITDGWYRTHENSEISMRFEMPADLAEQLRQERAERMEPGAAQRGDELTETEKRAQPYYIRQNLTRKIWDAEQLASTMSQYNERKNELGKRIEPEFSHIVENVNQEDAPEDAAAWQNYFADQLSDQNMSKAHPHAPLDTTSARGQYLAEHGKVGDPVYEAIKRPHYFAGTNDLLPEWSRGYDLAGWDGLKTLTKAEFDDMMRNITAFNVEVNEQMSSDDIEKIRNQQLAALHSYKQMLLRETEFLKEKYGCGLRLEDPFTIRGHYAELRKDLGDGQSETMMFEALKKYGILDESDPADLEMETTIYYIYTSFSAIVGSSGDEHRISKNTGNAPSYADVMRRSTLRFQQTYNNIDKSTIMRMKELERRLGDTTMVKWGLQPHYADI